MCIPLHDPDGEIARLKQSVAAYPEALRNRIVEDSLWLAEFSLSFCSSFTRAVDICNAVGCMTRISHYLVQALFALNEEYFVSDKYANLLIEQFAVCPTDFTARLARILSSAGAESSELNRSVDLLRDLWLETVALTAGKYKPRFHM